MRNEWDDYQLFLASAKLQWSFETWQNVMRQENRLRMEKIKEVNATPLPAGQKKGE